MAVHAILKVEILQNYIHFLRWNLRILLRVKHAFFYTWALRYRIAITIIYTESTLRFAFAIFNLGKFYMLTTLRLNLRAFWISLVCHC